MGGWDPALDSQYRLRLCQAAEAGEGRCSHGDQSFFHLSAPLIWLQNTI